MTAIPAQQAPHDRAVRWWLLSIAALIAIMVLVGGATRLTESGLSIVEWKPVTGTLPPLNQAQWTEAFEAYKTIPQYRELNAGMNLAEFKTIFWWEWSHRLLGRVIGVAYLLPFLWFLWRGALSAELRRRLWLIFGLGALQGAVGWWMVASGLSQRVEVSQYRLATHLVLALLIFAAVVWTLRRLAERPSSAASSRLKITGAALLVLTFVQLYLGALVAGLRAGRERGRQWRALAGGGGDVAGDARHPDAAQPGSHRSRSSAPGRRHRRLDAGGPAGRTIGRAASGSEAAKAGCAGYPGQLIRLRSSNRCKRRRCRAVGPDSRR